MVELCVLVLRDREEIVDVDIDRQRIPVPIKNVTAVRVLLHLTDELGLRVGEELGLVHDLDVERLAHDDREQEAEHHEAEKDLILHRST